MAQTDKEIIVKIDNQFFNAEYFGYLPKEDFLDIVARLNIGSSLVCAFCTKEGVKFCAVFDNGNEFLHVREVSGFFGKLHRNLYKALDSFACGAAKFYGKDKVSFGKAKRGLRGHILALSLGYEFVKDKNEYIKAI
jgi:hypothetical protein